jgi:hypothetical protein
LAAKKARGERLGNPNIGNRILHAVMKARDIGLEGFNAPADLNALHVWQLAGRKATIRLKRDREFAGSPVEQRGFELLVPPACARFEKRMPPPSLLGCAVRGDEKRARATVRS